MNVASVDFRSLLAYNHSETERWHAFFVKHPEALGIEVGGKTPKIRNLVAHIFQAEKWFASVLLGEDLPPAAYAVNSESLDEMFTQHESAHAMLARYLETADGAALGKMHEFKIRPGFQVSSQKLLVQFMYHGVNHWGQIAMLVRRAGLETGAPHDIILSSALQ